MSDKVREAGEYVAALKRAACGSGDKQADAYLSDMIDSVVGIVRAAALEEAAAVCEAEERRLESHGDGSGDAEECARLIRALAGRGA